MRNRTKWIGLLALVFLLLMQVACGNGKSGGNNAEPGKSSTGQSETGKSEASEEPSQETKQEPVKLKLMMHVADDTRKAIAQMMKDRLAEKLPGYEVEFELVGTATDWENKLRTYNVTGDLPDVFYMAGAPSFPIIKAGNVIDLTSYIQEDGFAKKYSDPAVLAPASDGKMYAMPEGFDFYFNPRLFYNKDIFEKYGLDIPKTYDELLAVSKTLNDKGVIPMVVPAKDFNGAGLFLNIVMMMLDNPQTVLDLNDHKIDWSDPKVIAALNRVKQLVNEKVLPEGVVNLDYGAAANLFATKKAAMYAAMTWDLSSIEKTPDVDFMLWPQVNPAVDPNSVTMYWGAPNSGYAVSSKSKHIAEAVKLAEYAAEISSFGFTEIGKSPSALKTDAKMDMSDLAKRNLEQFDQTTIKVPPLALNLGSKMFSEYLKLSSSLLTGQYTGEQFAKDIAKPWEEEKKGSK
ncbi:ABC transporter substrate-binding protein [Cohnella silvisoli]|uniref:Extracellular solute-binding protein n=1 Tax=Cohnella silvisoli TaxID=2873699 RepID=A0ABV1KSF6_9BACL|nr:extracellular solute-binding protein [Cohnella silvisoli]MCD9021293.1 extracellular solute-binding protein [Cohnella silvisoli]